MHLLYYIRPNLGGLARTCEIFGAKKLVLGNMKVINDPMFQQVLLDSI